MVHTAALATGLVPETPLVPETVAALDIRQSVVEDLLLKILYLNGPMSLSELATRSHVSIAVVSDLLRRFRSEQLCEVTGMRGNVPHLAITSKGRAWTMELLAMNQYAGPAPVALSSYIKQVQQQSVREIEVHPNDVQRAFSHLVLEPRFLKKLGAALNSGSAIFLYGPSGTGKTSIATAFPKALGSDEIWVPYAVEVDNQIIAVHDPVVHRPVERANPPNSDPRWVLCRRPMVLVGGELTLEMLELRLNPVTRYYAAPFQMKANNGVLIVDDFGRQRMRPEDLLNRWVVPLDRRTDFLMLAGGKQIEIPFEMFVVFATNLSPSSLVDAAFLRRIQTKLEVGAMTEAQFHEIFRWVCDEFAIPYNAVIVDELIDLIRRKFNEPLRACHPRDILNQIRWEARYEQRLPTMDRDAMLAAVEAYFVSETKPTAPQGGLLPTDGSPIPQVQ